MAITDDTLAQLRNDIESTLQGLKTQLGKLRTGRAHISILDGVRVNYYGTPTPLNQVANLSVADARLIIVKPWERGIIGEIEKGIQNSNIGITPQNDGETIR